MKLELLLPYQLKQAIEQNKPLLIAFGNIEYHASHLAIGCDGIVAQYPLEQLEKRYSDKVILAPPFYYGTSSFAVAGNEKGTISIDSQTVCKFAQELFTNFLRMGFRNIHAFVAHQTENFEQGMPLDLALRFAGRRAIFEYLEQEKGQGWWGNKEMANYYDTKENIFDAIQVHGEPQAIIAEFSGDHAGKLETSAMMYINQDAVRMDLHDCSEDWFSEDAVEATKEYGEKYIEARIDYFAKMLKIKE